MNQGKLANETSMIWTITKSKISWHNHEHYTKMLGGFTEQYKANNNLQKKTYHLGFLLMNSSNLIPSTLPYTYIISSLTTSN